MFWRRLIELALLCLAGCGTARDVKPAPSASLVGSIDFASFPSAVTSVDAVDETGGHLSAAVLTEGAFRIALPVGHTYRLVAMRGWDSDPILFRHDGELDDTVEVRGGSSTVALGSVRYYGTHAVDDIVHPEATETCDGTPNAALDAGAPKRELAAASQPKAIAERTPPPVLLGCTPPR